MPAPGEPRPVARPPALLDVDALLAAYEHWQPDARLPDQQVRFGTSGHRGCALHRSLNRAHVLAITQAICDCRAQAGITGPVFVATDTHAVSAPARTTVLGVLQANGVTALVAPAGEFTPTPVLSHAILRHNRSGPQRQADGIVLTPSHNPPRDGGLKYNPPHGGPAGTRITGLIERVANAYLCAGLRGVKGITTGALHRADPAAAIIHDFIGPYVDGLTGVLNLPLMAGTRLRLGIDAMGGAGLQYWPRIAERHRLDITLFNAQADPQFAFMPPDQDGQIRMDPASPAAMRDVVARAPAFDLSLACDTDHDRHGVVTGQGLMAPNHFLAAAADYLFSQRPHWPPGAGVGKSMVTTCMLARVAHRHARPLLDMPVGFKWFVAGLCDGRLGFVAEESAGATLLCRDGSVWTTDKDGMVAALLAAEITAHDRSTPDQRYDQLGSQLGRLFEARGALAGAVLRPGQAAPPGGQHGTVPVQVAGHAVQHCLTRAPGNGQPLGGVRLDLDQGWVALRPSGTEAQIRVYAESAIGQADALQLLAAASRMTAQWQAFS